MLFNLKIQKSSFFDFYKFVWRERKEATIKVLEIQKEKERRIVVLMHMKIERPGRQLLLEVMEIQQPTSIQQPIEQLKSEIIDLIVNSYVYKHS